MRYSKIDKELFIQNRANFCQQLKPNSIVIINSADLMPRTADQDHEFRQNSDMLYLTGIDQELSTLVLFPDASADGHKEILFIRETSEHVKVWEGEKFTKEEAKEISGIGNILFNDRLESILGMLINRAEHIYLNLNEHDRAVKDVEYIDLRMSNKLKTEYPLHKFERAAPILAELRTTKHQIEIDLMRKACNITKKGFERVLEFVKPGVWEFEIEAEITHEFVRNRSKGHAYSPIIASGGNACVLHYVTNNKQCQNGDLVLFDFGADYANYASDMSRTIPVNGRFSNRQKAVYNACLRVFKEARSMMRAGMVLNDFNKEVGLVMQAELLGLGLLKQTDIDNQNSAAPAYKKYFPHGTAHFLGIDVHDVGDRYAKLSVGTVLTCEPGIYIQDENLGVRIENDILVTDKGPVDLMQDIAIEVEEIEDLMNRYNQSN